jgi:peptide deformylase
MALFPILKFPDSRLRTLAKPVTKVDAAIQKLADDMIETMYSASGVGLAATQINIHQRVVVIDVSEGGNEPWVLINPTYEPLSQDLQEVQEGCLSVPEFYEEIIRFSRIRFSALDRNGKLYKEEAEGLLAVCVQHELDHLDGKLFVDKLSRLKRDRILRKLGKKHRQQQQT